MKIACIGYRDWALKIYDSLANKTEDQYLIFRSKAQYKEEVLVEYKPDLVLFYGWSWMVPENLINKFKCVMLHPSPLPKYRGGSPIQNQIIAGEINSAVTLFLMNSGDVDSGPILATKELSLDGNIKDIFSRITEIGLILTLDLISNGLSPIDQNHKEATFCKRRSPKESEITMKEINECTALHLYNKIRMLQSPYPNAYIKTKDGKRLMIKDAIVNDDI
mgnify:CR=1 FL=1